MPTGVELIAAERERQIAKWPAEHDDEHDDNELIQQACILAGSEVASYSVAESQVFHDAWHVLEEDWNAIKRLTVAGALIAAEIDRLQRLKGRE